MGRSVSCKNVFCKWKEVWKKSHWAAIISTSNARHHLHGKNRYSPYINVCLECVRWYLHGHELANRAFSTSLVRCTHSVFLSVWWKNVWFLRDRRSGGSRSQQFRHQHQTDTCFSVKSIMMFHGEDAWLNECFIKSHLTQSGVHLFGKEAVHFRDVQAYGCKSGTWSQSTCSKSWSIIFMRKGQIKEQIQCILNLSTGWQRRRHVWSLRKRMASDQVSQVLSDRNVELLLDAKNVNAIDYM